MTDFVGFNKIARYSRECVITEKIDGTNACIFIGPDGEFLTGSKTRWIVPGDDNFGFAKWAHEHKDELLTLGPGRHFGEWWGRGIQRNYGLTEKRLSLFNTSRWCLHGETPKVINGPNPKVVKYQDVLPACVGLVPIVTTGLFTSYLVTDALCILSVGGSLAVPGFKNPEGIVIFHIAGNVAFKKTFDKDDQPKGVAE